MITFKIFVLREDNMVTRHKLTLINGTMDTEGDIQTLRYVDSLKVGACPAGWIAVPPLPFPNDDDDRDDFDQTE